MTLLQACVFSIMRRWNTMHQASQIRLLVEDVKISSQQEQNYPYLHCYPLFWNRVQSQYPTTTPTSSDPLTVALQMALLLPPSTEESFPQPQGGAWLGQMLKAGEQSMTWDELRSICSSQLFRTLGMMHEPQAPHPTAARGAALCAMLLHFSAGTHLVNLSLLIGTR